VFYRSLHIAKILGNEAVHYPIKSLEKQGFAAIGVFGSIGISGMIITGGLDIYRYIRNDRFA
jgi:hypothetical protein